MIDQTAIRLSDELALLWVIDSIIIDLHSLNGIESTASGLGLGGYPENR